MPWACSTRCPRRNATWQRSTRSTTGCQHLPGWQHQPPCWATPSQRSLDFRKFWIKQGPPTGDCLQIWRTAPRANRSLRSEQSSGNARLSWKTGCQAWKSKIHEKQSALRVGGVFLRCQLSGETSSDCMSTKCYVSLFPPGRGHVPLRLISFEHDPIRN